MGNFRYASLRYCSVLKRNVVFENYYDSEGKGVCDCIYKSLCNYDKCGCRNSLFAGFMPADGDCWRIRARSLVGRAKKKLKIRILRAGSCFWGLRAVFLRFVTV